MDEAPVLTRFRGYWTPLLLAAGLVVLVYFATWCFVLLSSLNRANTALGVRVDWLRGVQRLQYAAVEDPNKDIALALIAFRPVNKALQDTQALPANVRASLLALEEFASRGSSINKDEVRQHLSVVGSFLSLDAITYSSVIGAQWFYLYLIVAGAFVLSASNLLLLAFARRSTRQLGAMAAYQEKTAILESLQEGVLVHTNGRILYANPAVAKILAEDSAQGLIGRSLPPLESPEELVTQSLAKHAQRSGAEIAVERSPTKAIVFEGKPASLVTLRDVTQETKMEARLRITDQLASVGTLAAGVAHEINNPLAYVLTNLSYALQECEPQGPLASLRAPLEEAQEGALRVQRIVRDIKLFSRATDDPIGPTNVEAVLESSLNLTGHEIKRKANLVREYQPLPPARANEARLGQVFVNILINATQALKEKEKATNEMKVKTYTQDETIWIEISDNGPGIPEHILPRIFDPFFTTKPLGEGTGLGLSLCHGIVSSLGGTISVESTIGKGTLFKLSLPSAQGQVAPARRVVRAPTPSPTIQNARILIIDDEASIRHALQRLLRSFSVVSASNGEEALTLFPGEPEFSVILCDLMMPGCSGVELFQIVKEKYPQLAPKIIFMSGGVFDPQTQDFLAALPNHTLEKPFEHDKLIAVVREVLHKTGNSSQ